jgi:hypothetical protein
MCQQERAEFVAPWVIWHLVLFVLQVIIVAWCGDIITSYIAAHAVELAVMIVAVVISEGE